VKILYCNKYNFPFSGTEVYLFDLMRLMTERGHETALYSMADPRGSITKYDCHLVPNISFKSVDQTLWQKARLASHAVYSTDARRRLARMIGDFRPDVAHVRNIYHHLSPSILWELRKHRVPVLYHLNDFKMLCPNYNMVSRGDACERCKGGQFWHVISEDCYPGGRAAGAVLALEAYTHRWLKTYERCVDCFLVPSEFVRHKLVEYGWDKGRIDVLPHFQRRSETAPPPPPADAPILYFGRLSAEKGVADLLRAMRGLPSVRLNVAGDGPARGQLAELAKMLSLGNVNFLGQVGEGKRDELIEQSRFTVLPSRAYETLGKTILESYAQARTVIATDLGSRREFVRDGETGLLYPVGDIEKLQRALSSLCERPELAARMGRAGFDLVREKHSPDDHYRSVVSLYERMADSAESPRPIGSQTSNVLVEQRRKVRVAFIGARGVIGKYSGIEGYYEEVGSRLARRGHDVNIHCRSYFTPPQATHNGMRLVRLPTIRSKHLETAVHTLLASMHVLFQPFDIVHYHALGPSLFSFLPRLAGKKTVVTVQGLDWQRRKWNRFAAWVLRLGERAAIRLPQRTMVVSRTLQSYYRQRFGADTLYIPNGTLLRERQGADRILQLGLDTNRYVLFLGRFSPEKNCHLLIEAYEHLNTGVRLVLAGGANASDAYARSLRRHENDKVCFLDYVSGAEFEELLTNAMLFVLPSDLEGLSLALLEAMGAGLCVLASDIPENRELVDGAGFLFQAGKVADLERMLRFLISDSSARAWAGARAKKRIQQHYLWPDITAQVEAVYLDVLGWTRHAASDSAIPQNAFPVRKPARSSSVDCPGGSSRRAG
jgi:glycosyltransferase involved in cell wall biosynthesis